MNGPVLDGAVALALLLKFQQPGESAAGKALIVGADGKARYTDLATGTIIIDDTLSMDGAAANAKSVGAQITAAKTGNAANADWHLGLYIDDDGDICQREE